VVDESGLLFCLANADLLDYDVSQQAVRSLQLLTQGRASKYGVADRSLVSCYEPITIQFKDPTILSSITINV
jgi:hypothetical protein